MDKKDFIMPPGQKPSSKLYPISVFGKPKDIDLVSYKVAITGLVEREKIFTYEDILNLPRVSRQFDIHCVDGWSYIGSSFTGVLPKELFKEVEVKESGRYVFIKSKDGYSTDLPLDFLLSEDALLAFEMDEKKIDIANGFPMRLVVNGKYAYKDAKWVVEFEVIDHDKPGFWEEKGYSRTADIYKNDRREF